jgi:methionyl-tRNA formyltransferase
MRFAFFETPAFAATVLQRLINGNAVPAVVIANPDRPAGRKKIITPPPTKILAEKHGIKVFQPEQLSAQAFRSEVGEIDFAVVAAYAKILPKEILDIPRLGIIGVHPSLLPKYRGASPIQSAILTGETETGVTLYRVDEKVDHGAILSQTACPIGHEGYLELEEKLANLGGELLLQTIPKFFKGEIIPKPQDESKATYTKKFKTEDGFVSPEDLERAKNFGGSIASAIHYKIRALNPEPGVWTIIRNKRVKLITSAILGGMLSPQIIQKEGGRPRRISPKG